MKLIEIGRILSFYFGKHSWCVFFPDAPPPPAFQGGFFSPLLSQFVLASMQLTVTTGIVLAFWVLVLSSFLNLFFTVDYNIYICFLIAEMHRDSCPLDCKVYVGNLGNNGNKTELERAFGYYGPLRSVWVARNPPGFAFVEFEDPRDAADAVRELDGR